MTAGVGRITQAHLTCDGVTPHPLRTRQPGRSGDLAATSQGAYRDWFAAQSQGVAGHEILARAGIPYGVEPGELSAHLTPVSWPRGRVVFIEGEPGDRLYVIVAGKIKISRRTHDGRENLLALLGPTDLFGEMSLFDPGPRSSGATAVTDVDAVWMDRTTLRACFSQQPQIAEQLLQFLARRVRHTNDNVTDLVFTDLPGRVAKRLLQLAQRFGTWDQAAIQLNHGLTQEELAQLVGSSRESVNRVLADFVSRG